MIFPTGMLIARALVTVTDCSSEKADLRQGHLGIFPEIENSKPIMLAQIGEFFNMPWCLWNSSWNVAMGVELRLGSFKICHITEAGGLY
jgi:hypothetical protein